MWLRYPEIATKLNKNKKLFKCIDAQGLLDTNQNEIILNKSCTDQVSVISQMEWVPFKSLFWNTTANLMISFTSSV